MDGCFRFADRLHSGDGCVRWTAFAAIALLLAVPSGARAQGPSTSKPTAPRLSAQGACLTSSQWAWTRSHTSWSSGHCDHRYELSPLVVGGGRRRGRIQKRKGADHYSGRPFFWRNGSAGYGRSLDQARRPVKLAIGLDSVFQRHFQARLAAISISISAMVRAHALLGAETCRGSCRMSTSKIYLAALVT